MRESKVEIFQSDVMRQGIPLADGSIQVCCTSPPYWGQRDYGHECQLGSEKVHDCLGWATGLPCGECYVCHMVQVFQHVRRVLRDNGTLWINLGYSYNAYNGGAGPSSSISRGASTTQRLKLESGYGLRTKYLKPKDLIGIPWLVAFALQADGWYLRSAPVWVKRCLSGGTVLYARTQKGDMPMAVKDLVRLRPDTVKLWNGEKWTQCLHFWKTLSSTSGEARKARVRKAINDRRNGRKCEPPTGELEISLRNGQRLGCTGQHVWPTQRGNVRADELCVGDVIRSVKLPEPEVPKCPESLPDELIGWFVGLYLAEGCKSAERVLVFCGHKNETESRVARLSKIAERFHGSVSFANKGIGNGATVGVSGKTLFGIIDTYLSGCDAHTKCLTTKCWQRSNVFLRALLEGYLEGDGHWEDASQRWRLGFCRNDNLARDIRAICARIGASVRLKRCSMTATKGGKPHSSWRGSIRLHVPKVVRPGGFERKPDCEVTAIGYGKAKCYWDIEVEDEPHLFALASGVLTHNSAMPSSVTDRPSTATEQFFLLAKSERYYYDVQATRLPGEPHTGLAGTFSRPTGKQTELNIPGQGYIQHREQRDDEVEGGRNRRDTDWWFDSLRHWLDVGGLVTDEQGLPLGTDFVNGGYKGAHFATYPYQMVVPNLKASTSEKGCCPKCGTPYERVIEKERVATRTGENSKVELDDEGRAIGGDAIGNRDPLRHMTQTRTVDWRPGCECAAGEPVPCRALDCFSGAGSTAIACLELGLDYVGTELSEPYIAMSHERIAAHRKYLKTGVKPKAVKKDEGPSMFDGVDAA